MKPAEHILPDGTTTPDVAEYVRQWRGLAVEFAVAVNGDDLHIGHTGWDDAASTVSFTVTVGSRHRPEFTLPVALVRAVAELGKLHALPSSHDSALLDEWDADRYEREGFPRTAERLRDKEVRR